jgi:hypothetical protein
MDELVSKEGLNLTDIHALIYHAKGSYKTERIDRKPLDNTDLLTFSEPISADCRVIFWYPKELSYDTARWLAKDFAVDFKRDLLNQANK